eukprot:TRINITY_DN834_c0_g1_i1.p1 TRINITY_DN834_c0_g1~~TRINITY_DN834_c0_g1_i1.p1  ORF type:complete len:318 (-),score=126.87 TRINITY_DN834_c0_g1_i1:43-996(-)
MVRAKRVAKAKTKSATATASQSRTLVALFAIALAAAVAWVAPWQSASGVWADSAPFNGTRAMSVACADNSKGSNTCQPSQCGRAVRHAFASDEEVAQIRALAHRAFATLGSEQRGPVAMFDLASGALGPTVGDGGSKIAGKFVDGFRELHQNQQAVSRGEFELLMALHERVRRAVAEQFDVAVDQLHAVGPNFLSRLGGTNLPRKINDEYWHEHIDTIAYGAFTYTALVYLSDSGREFDGGAFVFDGDTPATVAPTRGRLLLFTSGAENPHHVEPVRAHESRVRYALTLAFTCNASAAIDFLVPHRRWVDAQRVGVE